MTTAASDLTECQTESEKHYNDSFCNVACLHQLSGFVSEIKAFSFNSIP